jgi:GMP synthase (glutamine-hydrolysing)
MREKIIVLDFGSQYNQLIVRRIRELGVYAELVKHTISADAICADKTIRGIVFSGSPKSVNEDDFYDCDDGIFDLGLPILGICYGMQLLVKKFGGVVTDNHIREYGIGEIEIKLETDLFVGTPVVQSVLMSHGCSVDILGDNFEIIATSTNGAISAIKHVDLNI